MENEISVLTESSSVTFDFTLASVGSFIKQNPWFSGVLRIGVHRAYPLTEQQKTKLRLIYERVELFDLSPTRGTTISPQSIHGKALISFLEELHRELSLHITRKTLYFSSRSLFINGVQDMVSPGRTTVSNALPGAAYIDSEEAVSAIRQWFLRGEDPFSRLKFLPASIEVANGELSSVFVDRKYSQLRPKLGVLSFILFDTFQKTHRFHSKINGLWQHSLTHAVNVSHNNSSHTVLRSTNNYVIQNSPIIDSRISVIIPAYRASQYIEECLDSIFNQTSHAEIEVLVCVDNCQETLFALSKIRHKYPKLRIFRTLSQCGPYVIRNSLVQHSKHPNLLFFDADDIMKTNMISSILSRADLRSQIRFKYFNFRNSSSSSLDSLELFSQHAHGVFFIPKETFNRIGGFQPWPCGADTEFIKRCKVNKIPSISIDEGLFYRRIHQESLTQNSQTGYSSSIRNKIKKWIQTNNDWRIPIATKTVDLISE